MNDSSTPFRLDGKVALISGAGRGIGASCARALASAGAAVVVSDIETGPAAGVVTAIEETGGKAMFASLNVTDEAQWEQVIKTTVETYGGLDVVVNNAGVESMSFVDEMSLESWQKVMRVNADGVFLGVKQGIRAMKPGGIAGRGGSIVNMASICAMIAMDGSASYSAAKAAVTMLTKVAAVECGKKGYGIRVNSVHPGVILTELVKAGMQESAKQGIFASPEEAEATYASQHPIGRLGEPEDIANAVLYLASDASSFVTGSQFVIDGGYITQ